MTKKIYLWKNDVPNQKKFKNVAIIEFDKREKITRISEVTNPLIEIFEPEEKNNNGKAILICPGGSYKILAIDLEGTEPALWLNKLGYTVYLLQYRVPNNLEGAFNDIQRAFKIIKNKFYHTKIGLLGFSAGGNLAARLSTNSSKLSYIKVDKIDVETCKPDFTLLIYPAYLDLGKNNTVSPNLLKDKNLPPIFIFGTEDDPYYKSIPVFVEYLKTINCKFELHTLTSGGHGYGLRKGNKAAETWPLLAEKWLNSITEKMNTYKVNCIKEKEMSISGMGNDPVWKKANSLTDFSSPWDNEPVKKIEFKAIHNSEKIFFQFKVDDNQTHIHLSEDKNDSINSSDRVELFFRSDASLDPYYCLEIDTTARIMDFKARPNRKLDFNWNWPSKDIEVKSSINKNHFIVEIAISLASLKKLNLLKNGFIETGIYRAKYKQQKKNSFEPTWITWINPKTETPNFHTPTSFGVLKLEN